MRSLILTLALLSLAAPVAAETVDPAEVASMTFIRGCLHHMGAYGQLRARLMPGQDLALPRLPPAEARPFLKGREGEVWVRPDAGVSLALTRDDECTVFIRKANPDALYRQLEKDVRLATAKAFTVQTGGRESKGALLSRFLDLNPTGEYREELVKQFGTGIPGLRIILTTSETANPNLQGIITLGARQP